MFVEDLNDNVSSYRHSIDCFASQTCDSIRDKYKTLEKIFAIGRFRSIAPAIASIMTNIFVRLFKYRLICFIFIWLGMKTTAHGLNTSNYKITDSYEDRVSLNELISLSGYKYFGPMLEDARLQKVNAFWLQFEPPSKATFYIFGIIYAIVFVVGCGGNMFVIIMFCRTKNLLTPATTLVLNLAVSDFLMLAKCPIAIYNNFMQGPAMGDIGCRIYGFLGGLSGTVSILTLTAIAVDRYYVVVHPMGPLRSRNRLRPMIMIIFIWIYSFIFSIVPALNIGFSVYVPEGFLTTCSFDYLDKTFKARVFMFTFFVCAYVIPLNIILFSYFYILKVVFSSDRVQANQNRNKIEQKLAIVVVLVIFLWFVAWTPYSIVAMMGVFGYQEYLTPFSSMVPALFCKTAACIDPYIYAATHPRFRLEFQRFVNQSFELRRMSIFASSIRTRSTATNATNRLRSINDQLSIEHNNRPMVSMRNNNLEAVIEEEIIQEDAIDVVASVEIHNIDNSRY